MAQHCSILYIPGLGDGYDPVRRLGLLSWRRPGVDVVLVPMRWRDNQETFEQKMSRIKRAIDMASGPVVLVGESAGGAMALVAATRFAEAVDYTVTLCGMNQGAQRVNPRLYQRNPVFEETMKRADRIVPTMSAVAKKAVTVVYSSQDLTVRPRDTLITGVESIDLHTPGHMTSILSVLYLRGRLITDIARR